MAKPYDISKFRKSITKSIEGISAGFTDPVDWVSTGNYALNYLISGDFNKGIPLGKVTMFAGESGCLPAQSTVCIRVQQGDVIDVTIAKLKDLYKTQTYFEVSTPDGFRQITEWFDKGVLPMARVSTKTYSTLCAENHLLQLSDLNWVLAKDAMAGNVLLTQAGNEVVTAVSMEDPAECFDFTIHDQNHRYWGDGFSSHNSGKSYICSGNVLKDAQRQGIYVILIDSENALDETWLHALDVDTSEDKMLKLNMCMIDDLAKTISDFVKEYRLIPVEERPKVLFVVDSLGMMMTPTDKNQFDEGSLRGDMGRKPKALGAIVRNCVNMFGDLNIGMVCTNHTYASQDPYSPDDKVSGGSMAVYAASIVVAMKKLKLKEDEDGVKTKTVNGIRSGCKIMKTRYAKPFEDIELHIPYSTGMAPTSGLFELLEKKSLISKEGNRYSYTDLNGEIHKYYRKEWNKNTNGIFDLVISEFEKKAALVPVSIQAEPEQDDTEE